LKLYGWEGEPGGNAVADLAETSLGVRDLEALYELAAELLQLEDYDQMLDVLVRRSLDLLRAERGFLVLKRGETGELDFRVVRNWNAEELSEGREPVSRSIVAEALRLGKPLLVEDALGDPRFSSHESVQDLGLRTVLAAPLIAEGRPVGALYLESRSAERLFEPQDLELFTRVLVLASRALAACAKRLGLEQRASLLEKDLLARYDFAGIVTRDAAFLKLLQTVAQVAGSDLPVLVQGPSGSGKELVSRALHLNSPRARGPFLTLNCGAISPQLLESELFGHVKGAFTGAVADRVGMIPQAGGGTLFLDEVGELPRELQVKLLRTLQFGEVQPVGSARPQSVNVRFVAATNRDLEQEVREGRFREDLLYRLNAITLHLPPLKERPDDILPLFQHFLGQAARRAGREAPKAGAELERALQAYGWPGNVRELENEAGRLLALTPPGLPLSVERLSRRITQAVLAEQESLLSLEEREREVIALHLRLAGGNRSQAARSLGISREGLRTKMKRLGLK
jgi:transcriptional regulator with GAF, ATPase, and Fis domain